MDEKTRESLARRYAQTARDAYDDAAVTLRALPEDEWSGPTGCAGWDVRTLAGHIVGEAVWFANLTRGVTTGEAALPDALYESLKALPPHDLADRLQEAAEAVLTAIVAASSAQLQAEVDLGWTRMPLWRATYVAAEEAVYHGWDLYVGRDPAAVIPTPWAQTLASGAAWFAPLIARRDGIASAPGRYLLRVGDGVGPVTVAAQNGHLAVEQAEAGAPDVTLALSADQYVRLIAGRLPLDRVLEQRAVTAEGDRGRLLGLNRIFSGIWRRRLAPACPLRWRRASPAAAWGTAVPPAFRLRMTPAFANAMNSAPTAGSKRLSTGWTAGEVVRTRATSASDSSGEGWRRTPPASTSGKAAPSRPTRRAAASA